MNKKLYSSLVTLAVLVSCICPATGIAQVTKSKATTASTASNDPLMSLPESDGVVSVDVQRLLNDVLPRVLSDAPARLAEVNSRIDQIKTRTGIDVRMFDRIAVGVRFVNGATPDSLKVDSVALARGRFDAPLMLSAGLVAANSKYKYTKQQYRKKTIYVFNSDDLFGKEKLPQIEIGDEAKKAGGKPAEIADNLLQKIMSFKGEVAIVAIDANTLAIGQPGRVRAAIDASVGRVPFNSELTQLATQNPNAVVGFGVNMPANASSYIGLDMDNLAAKLNAIRQVYGSVNSTATGFEMQNIARTTTDAEAKDLYAVLDSLKGLGGFVISNLTGDKRKLAQTALDNLKIVKEGKEVHIRIELAQADVAMLVRVFDKRN